MKLNIIKKLPLIKSKNGLTLNFLIKYNVFINAMYLKTPEIQNGIIKWPNSEFYEITKNKIKFAINSFYPKKTPRPKGYTFLII